MTPPTVYNLSDLPVEEQDYVLQLGKISRPFAHDARSPLLRRTLELYYTLQAAKAWEVTGVDVSYWQGNIDWQLLSQHIIFAIIRAGYGNKYVDPTCEPNVRGAEDNGAEHGLYWYMTVDKNWATHAQTYYSVWKDLGGSVWPSFDLEESRGQGKSAIANWMYKSVHEFCDLSGQDPIRTILYTSAGFYNRYVEYGIIKFMRLWVAHWTLAQEPILPRDWNEWLFWQWTSRGKKPGVSTNVDENRFYSDITQFNKLFKTALPPPPPPGPPPVPAYVIVNTNTLNIRTVPTTATGSPIGETSMGKIWKTTGEQQLDTLGRGYWYEVADKHGQNLWLAGWLTKPGQ